MPIDRGIIDQQLQALGESSHWWDHRELRDLPAVLDAGEQILALARGKIARVRWLRRSWLIVVTDRRLLCQRSAGRTGWRQLEVSALQFTRVAIRVGVFHGRVLLTAGGQT
ncbi:MAG: PH domain-containing protein, partial [Longimicrobiales bacterium]